MTHLYLIGLPGAGKTTLGQQLAAHYGRPFVDLDAAIVAAAGQDIPAIFAAEGEAGFRAREAAALAEVAGRAAPLVVATGGGTPCFGDNLARMRTSGFVLWLDGPLPELARRLAAAGQAAARPLLAGAVGSPQAAAPTAPTTAPAVSAETALLAWLTQTRAARARFYAQAQLRHPGGPAPEVAAALAAAGFAA